MKLVSSYTAHRLGVEHARYARPADRATWRYAVWAVGAVAAVLTLGIAALSWGW